MGRRTGGFTIGRASRPRAEFIQEGQQQFRVARFGQVVVPAGEVHHRAERSSRHLVIRLSHEDNGKFTVAGLVSDLLHEFEPVAVRESQLHDEDIGGIEFADENDIAAGGDGFDSVAGGLQGLSNRATSAVLRIAKQNAE